MNQDIRTTKEMQNLFADKKNARKAWQAIGRAILQNPASLSPEQYDKDGNLTMQSELEKYTYKALADDIKELGKDNRKPTELEMIMYGQIVKARWDTAAAVFVRDTLGAKPVDESKVDASLHNPYEELTDEELEVLAKLRAEKQEALGSSPSSPALPDASIVEHDNNGMPVITATVTADDVQGDLDDTTHIRR